MRILIATLLLTLMVGCSTINARVATWEGNNINDFIVANGGPTYQTTTNGQTHYTWLQGQCTLVVTTDDYGTILSGRARGIC